MMKVEVYLPPSYEEKLVDALVKAGYLIMGDYDRVYSSHKVMGHWRPLEGSDAFSGEVGKKSKEEELLLSFRAKKEEKEALHALIKSIHPYETPRIDCSPLL